MLKCIRHNLKRKRKKKIFLFFGVGVEGKTANRIFFLYFCYFYKIKDTA
jgi:hypothetical protein